MNIYRIYQDENNGYDTYDSAVVYARTAEDASKIHPSGEFGTYPPTRKWWENPNCYGTWTHPDNVRVEYIGKSNVYSESIICASFNAG